MQAVERRSTYDFHAAYVKQYAEMVPFLASQLEIRDLLLEGLKTTAAWQISLPLLTACTASGLSEKALPAAAAWLILKQAAYLLDNLLDGDTALPPQYNQPYQAYGLVTAATFAAFRLLALHEIPATAQALTAFFAESGLASVEGMRLDFSTMTAPALAEPDLERYWQMVILKSGSIYRAAAAGGAIAAGADQPLVQSLGDFGTALGVIQQVVDDSRDWQDAGKHPTGEVTLPILIYALTAGNTAAQALSECSPEERGARLATAGVPQVISEIVLEWRKRALAALEGLPASPERDALVAIPDLILGIEDSPSEPQG